jgi:hypothetical protein
MRNYFESYEEDEEEDYTDDQWDGFMDEDMASLAGNDGGFWGNDFDPYSTSNEAGVQMGNQIYNVPTSLLDWSSLLGINGGSSGGGGDYTPDDMTIWEAPRTTGGGGSNSTSSGSSGGGSGGGGVFSTLTGDEIPWDPANQQYGGTLTRAAQIAMLTGSGRSAGDQAQILNTRRGGPIQAEATSINGTNGTNGTNGIDGINGTNGANRS